MEGGDNFLERIAALHAAEVAADETLVAHALAALPVTCAPNAWRVPFAADAYCKAHLLANCPAAFWRRLAKRFPQLSSSIGSVCATLCEEDLLDIAEPELSCIMLGKDVAIMLREGSYSSGGIGRHVYAAATALGTLLCQQQTIGGICLPSVAGLRVLELGCGLGLVGLAAAKLGAASVTLTDSSESSVSCASANAALNGFNDAMYVRSRQLDWNEFTTAASAATACTAAGLGVPEGDELMPWWPDVILAADVCYSDAMGCALTEALTHILANSPSSSRAFILNGWPNRGLARFETLCGARGKLAAQEQRSFALGEPTPPHRPFVELQYSGDAADAPRGLENLQLLGAERLTGFADHAHHLYVFCHKLAR